MQDIAKIKISLVAAKSLSELTGRDRLGESKEG